MSAIEYLDLVWLVCPEKRRSQHLIGVCVCLVQIISNYLPFQYDFGRLIFAKFFRNPTFCVKMSKNLKTKQVSIFYIEKTIKAINLNRNWHEYKREKQRFCYNRLVINSIGIFGNKLTMIKYDQLRNNKKQFSFFCCLK